MGPLRCAIALALLAQLSLALYTPGVPIGVFQGRTDTATPTALANAGFTNVTVIDINNIDATELTQFDVLVYAPDVGMDPDMYAKLTSAGMFNRVARLLHQGKINVLVMGQPYQHTYYFVPFYQCTYSCSGASKDLWSVDNIAEPYDPFWRYPNTLIQSNLSTIGTTVPHYIFQRAWSSYTDGRVLATAAGDYPVVAEMRWGVGKMAVNAWNNGCISAACAPQYYKFLQNTIAYLTSVDISAPVRASMDGANITVTVSSGQADRVRLALPKWVNADQTDKMLSGNSATFALTATYPGLYVIKAETFLGSSLNRTGEAWVQIGFTSTNVAPRIALIEPRSYSATEEGLDMMGIAYTTFDSLNIYSINLSAYDLVIVDYEIAYRGDAALRTALISMKNNITNWVNITGGKLLMFGQNTPFQEFAPISNTLYGSPTRSSGWPFVIIDPYHQIHSYPHPFTNTEYSYVSNLLDHWLFQGSTGIEGDHPFSYDSSQSYQVIGIKKVGNGIVIGTAFVPWWYYHDRPSQTEKQHDYQIQFIDNLFAVLNLNFTGYQKDWFAYNVRAIRCGSMMPNASVTVYLPGTTTVADTAAGDASGNAIVHLNYGKYDVKIALQDGTFKTFYNQVFN